MSSFRIPWWQPLIGNEEHTLIKDVLDRNFPNEGKYATQFEQKIATLLGVKHAVAVSSGTAALFLSLKALGIGPGDEVIVPDMTFIATANAVHLSGAKPVLADVKPETVTLSPDSFLKSITSKTKAVIPVHVTGRGADMDEIKEIAQEHQFDVVEDAAEAFLSKHNKRFLGTFGATGCFSFSPNKIITTGQGGIVVTNDDTLHIKLRELKDQGRPTRGSGGDDIHHSMGYNFKFSDLQAAVGVGQLSHIDKRMNHMRHRHKLYTEQLSHVKGLSLYSFDIDSGELPLWTDIRTPKRDSLEAALKMQGIDSRKFWHPLHTQAPYKLPDNAFPNSLQVSKQSLWLPSAFTLSDNDILETCSYIKTHLVH